MADTHSAGRLPLLAGALALALLGGCSSAPKSTPETSAATGIQIEQVAQEAIEAEAKGNLVHAAQLHKTLASAKNSPEREDHLLTAAALLLKGRYIQKTEAVLAGLPPSLTDKQHHQSLQLQTRIALLNQNTETALKLIPADVAHISDPQIKLSWQLLRAETLELGSIYLEAARTRNDLDPALPPGQARLDNQRRIWALLHNVNPDALELLGSRAPQSTLAGWMQLVLLNRNLSEKPSQLRSEVNQWRSLNPEHPANEHFIEGILSGGNFTQKPQNIALLLPLSGNLEAPAKAIRDGFLAAHLNRQEKEYTPRIRVYDTQSSVEAGLQAYHQASDDGAELIVGPLNKQLAEEIAVANEIKSPTLALNYISHDGPTHDTFFQYGLLPEDEARQVAERAWLDGYSSAVALVPEGEWGERMLTAFQEHWEQMDGTLLASHAYNPRKNDFAPSIRSILAVDQSQARHKALEALLDKTLKFEPRRRQDIDFVYMAAFPRQARVIRPQLKFYFAGDIPVYSTSHLYSGKQESSQDRDMDDIMFCDMPWVFGGGKGETVDWQTIEREHPKTADAYKRLYAMGIDAYALTDKLEYLKRYPEELHYGMTGNLYLDGSNRVHRQLLWAKFKRGKPRMLDPLPEAGHEH